MDRKVKATLKLGLLAALAVVLPERVYSQPATTTVSDTLYNAIGPTFCSGTITLSWNTFYSTDGFLIQGGKNTITVNTMGVFSASVVPTNTSTSPPSGIYTVQYTLTPPSLCSSATEFWNVPTGGGPVDLNMVRTLPSPPPSLIPVTSLAGPLTPGTYTMCYTTFVFWGSCGGTGTVTHFAAGNFLPLFNTSVSSPSMSPSLSFSAITQNPNLLFAGPTSGPAAAPTFRSLALADFPAIGSDTVLGNATGGSAVPAALSQTQLTALVNPFSSSLSGAVPGSGGGTTNFLRADGSWAAPSAGSGTVTSFSAGNLSPLFTTSVATPTTTPALSFSLSNAAGTSWFGNASGTSGAPSFNTTAFPNALIPTPTAIALGGIESITSLSHNWVAYIDTSGVPHQSQPAFSDLSGSATCAQLPALTGDTTTSAGSCTTATSKLNGGSVPASAHLIGTNSSSQPVAATAHDDSAILTCVAASGSGTAYTCTTSPTFTPATGDRILFKADVATTGSATLNVNSSSAYTIEKQGGGTALIANDLLAGQWCVMVLDATPHWQMQCQTGNVPGSVTAAPPYVEIGTTFYSSSFYAVTKPSSSPTWINSVTPTVTAATNGDVVISGTGTYWAETSGTTSIESEFSCTGAQTSGTSATECLVWAYDSTNSFIYTFELTSDAKVPSYVINKFSYNGTGNPSFSSNLNLFYAPLGQSLIHLKLSKSGGTLSFQVSLNGGITFTTLATQSVGTLADLGYGMVGNSATAVMDILSEVVN